MKKIISLILCLIFIFTVFSGCKQKEEVVFIGWLDDNEVLYAKIHRMNKKEVRNLIGNPSARLLNEDCEVFLKEDGEALFVSYDEDGLVNQLRSEDLTVISNYSNAQIRCRIMNKIMGKSKNDIIKRYGEPDEIIEKEKVLIYNNAFEAKVRIKFDDNFTAQKVFVEGLNEPKEKAEEPVLTLPENPLDDFEAVKPMLMGMTMQDMLNLLGDPQGYMEYADVRVYFDSNKNCIFIKCDDNRKVCEVEKMTYLQAMENQKENRYAWLVLLMNEFVGKSKSEINEKYNIRYIRSSKNTFGYDDIVRETVYLTYNKDDLVERVSLV